jgi:hypothetical protein
MFRLARIAAMMPMTRLRPSSTSTAYGCSPLFRHQNVLAYLYSGPLSIQAQNDSKKKIKREAEQ